MHFLKRLLQCLFVWGTPKPRGDLHEAQVILTQSMSDCTNGSVSKVHSSLAEYVQKLYDELGLPICAQGELAPALEARRLPLVGKTMAQIAYDVADPEYFGTYEVALEQVRFCAGRYRQIIPVQVTPAIWRAIWVYEKLGFGVIIPPGIPAMAFQENLKEWRWRRAITAYPYELAARLVYLSKGYI